MISRTVPVDAQKGELLGPGPTAAGFADSARSETVFVCGLSRHSYLARAILDEVFAEVAFADPGATALPDTSWSASQVVVIAEGASPLSWTRFLSWLGRRRAVVDVRTAAAMAQIDGCALEVGTEAGDRTQAIEVFRSHMACPVYPRAPRVRIVGGAAIDYGFGPGDEIHLYGPDEEALKLAGLQRDAALDDFCRVHNVQVWGETVSRGLAVLLSLATTGGGRVTIMDLRTVDREPEPSGVETLASQILLAALGVSVPRFGKFVTATSGYDTFIDAVHTVAATCPDGTVEPVGASVGGRPLWLFKTVVNPSAPVLFFSCGVHPLEWAPAYGVLRYIRQLLAAYAAGEEQAVCLLKACQIWWLPCVCPDGWETREQQPSGINLLRNFPGSWERCVPGETYYDGYNRRFAVADSAPLTARGPAPGSQPETQAVMQVLNSPGVRWAAYADFHETTAPDAFLHQHEANDGSLRDVVYHRGLAVAVAGAFSGRFYAHANALARRPALADFSTYSFRALRCLERPVPNPLSGTVDYAQARGMPASLVECAGCDCTHYQTVRRTEFAALAADQIALRAVDLPKERS